MVGRWTNCPRLHSQISTIRWNFLAPNELFRAELLHAVFSNTIVLVLCKKSTSLWLHMIWISASIYASGQCPNLSFLQPDHSMTSKLWLLGHTLFLLVLIKKTTTKNATHNYLHFPDTWGRAIVLFPAFWTEPISTGQRFLAPWCAPQGV